VQLSGVIVILLLFALARVIYFLPNAVLASMIIMTMLGLIDVRTARKLWREDKSDLLVRAVDALCLLHMASMHSSVFVRDCACACTPVPSRVCYVAVHVSACGCACV
jgi:MFS superfamily sulfate permease-like transporter